jgi:tetratricopeptide (TPR) repeat protein
MNMRRRAAVVFVVLLAAVHILAAGQAAPPSATAPWLVRLSSWLEAVNQHRPGTLDTAARLTGFSIEGDLYEAQTDFLALVAICKRELGRSEQPAPVVYRDTVIPFPELRQLLGLADDEAAKGNANRVLLRAAILHADVAMLVIPLLPGRTGCSARTSVLIRDGNPVGAGCVGFHWTNGRMLLDAVRPDPSSEQIVRLWYHATITYLLETGDFANADPQIGHGRLLFPSDPAILFEHGLYHEGFASPLIRTAALESGADAYNAKAHIDEADDLYRRVVKENPQFVEARVHHGYVLGLLGRHRDAAEELRVAAASAMGPQLRYYAELFLGHAEESLGNRVAARDHYRLASALYPQAQSPLLALALFARQFGDLAGTQDAMRRLLALGGSRADDADPWWVYYRWQNQSFKALFAELYALLHVEAEASTSIPDGGRR